MTGVFERVYEIALVFRAEKHDTSRHINKYTSINFEMRFIESFYDICRMATKMQHTHLLFRGMEITTGGQHVNIEEFDDFLMTHKYGLTAYLLKDKAHTTISRVSR